MDIETFVAESLKQIGRGVSKAANERGISISPRPYLADDNSNTAANQMVDRATNRVIVLVDFELSVAVCSKASGGIGTKLEVLGIGLGKGNVEGAIDQTRIQKLKFQVPVSFPTSKA